MLRTPLFTRTALGLALSLGLAAGTGLTGTAAFAKKAEQPAAQGKITPSKGFATAYVPFVKALESAKTRADVVAAKQKADAAQTALRAARGAARKQAQADFDAALAALGTTLTGEKTQLNSVIATATTPDDKYVGGQLSYQLGNLAMDSALKRAGISAMLDSGKAAPADAPNLQFALGSLAYDAGDYAQASKALSALATTNFPDESFGELLADSFARAGQPAEGLKALETAIASRKAANAAIPADWIRRGFIVAYNAKMGPQSMDWAYRMVEADPTPVNWVSAVQLARDNGNTGPQENLDMARLIFRNGAINLEKRFAEHEYVEYIQAADPRRLPGEVVKVAQAGVAQGALRANDTFVTDAISQGKSRIAADKAALVTLERDAKAPNATAVTIMAAADTFLSYDDAVKAEQFYNTALAKPGVDKDRALTRLGIAQYDQGKFADAQATFAKVAPGIRAPIARLWALQAKLKAAPAT